MAAADTTTTVMLQMLKEMQDKRRADQESRCNDVQRLVQVHRTGMMPVATSTSTGCIPLVKSNYDGYKVIRDGCYFCEEPHKSDHSLQLAESTTAPAASAAKYSGFVGGVRDSLGTGLFASIGID